MRSYEKIVKEDKRYKSRYRVQAILLSYQGKSVNELAEIFGCQIRTIYRNQGLVWDLQSKFTLISYFYSSNIY